MDFIEPEGIRSTFFNGSTNHHERITRDKYLVKNTGQMCIRDRAEGGERTFNYSLLCVSRVG